MSDGNSTSQSDSWYFTILEIVQFWLYVPFLIPSFVCTLFLLYVILFDRNLRQALNNHIIIVLLITGLICEIFTYPSMLYYRIRGEVWFQSPAFCSIWGFLDLGFYYMQIMLFAWASFERHILIFHDRWLRTERRRFLLHYLPIIIIILYFCTFYGIYAFFPPCENSYDYSVAPCLRSCMYESPGYQTIETFVHNIIPSFIIIILSIALLFRILQQKRRIRQPIQWRKHRKMTIQLLSISLLYLLVTCPYPLVSFLHLCGLSYDLVADFDSYAVFISYYAVLLFPFVAMSSVPEAWTKLKGILHIRRQHRRVAAAILLVTQKRNAGFLF